MSTLIKFKFQDQQVLVDLSAFTSFPTTGYANALVKANEVYCQCLDLYPSMERELNRLKATLKDAYNNDPNLKGSRGKSDAHFKDVLLNSHAEYQDLLANTEKIKRLVKEGIPVILAPNMRHWNDAMNRGGHTSPSMADQARGAGYDMKPIQPTSAAIAANRGVPPVPTPINNGGR